MALSYTCKIFDLTVMGLIFDNNKQPETALPTITRGVFMHAHLPDLRQCLIIPLDICVDILNHDIWLTYELKELTPLKRVLGKS